MTSTQTQKKQAKTEQKEARRETLPVGRFCWIALRAPDLDRARAFYGTVLGWRFSPGPGGMETFDGKGGPVGHLEPAQGAAAFHAYVVVADVDAAARRVKAAGGRTGGDAFALPGIGRMQEIADADGASCSLFQPDNAAAAAPLLSERVKGEGAFLWNELHARDEKAALAFLTAVVGYAVDVVKMGDSDYHLLKSARGDKNDESLAGVMRSMNPGAPSSWVPYFHVGDVDAARKRAVANGATALGDALDVDGVGRMAVLLDPQGAVFAVMTPVA